jgi:glycosyltransferase involved in cell wall biosynthesis
LNILIISFTFPPYSGIGGRRWAKFAKYLQKNGNDVEVLAAKSGFEKKSPWTSDVSQIKVSYHEAGYPQYLGIQPKSLIEKIAYRLSLVYSKWITKGNYYDKSAHWRKGLKSIVEEKVAEGIDQVFVTCAPFHMAYHLLPLVKKYRNIKWVVDFRDPWTTNRTSYGFENLSNERQQFELNAEKEVVKNYDEVISVAEPMTDYFKTLEPNNPQKFKTIFNGFDPDDSPKRTQNQHPDPGFFTFVFAGTLYDKALPAFKIFCQAVENLKIEDTELYNKLKFNFIGTNQEKVNNLRHPNISILPFLPFEKVRDYLYTANAGLLFLTPDIDWSFSTKFTDYIASELPILVVSEKGSKTGEFCEENHLGYDLNKQNIEILRKLLIDLEKDETHLSKNLKRKFSIQFSAKEILD